jgi:NitT/TauT family transport system substrate-binding protein
MNRVYANFRSLVLIVAGAILLAAAPALAQDKVKVGVFPISSSLPYFVALDLGYFKELNVEPETAVLMGGPPNVAALMTNQIEVSAVLVTLEGLNADVKKPGVAMYVAMHSQNAKYKMEQFVVRSGLADKVKTLADFKGLKLMSAPGPANLNTAKGILAKVGLKEGDYTIDQLDMGQHVNAMKAGAFAAGCAFSSDFISKRPDVAKRFAQAWAKAIDYIRANPEAARKYLAKNTMTPDNVVDTVPMLGYIMTKDMSPKQLGYLQEFTDFGVQIGVVPEKIDVKQDLKSF